MMRRFEYKLLADYYQFYLQDECVTGDLSSSWTQDAVDRLLAVAPGTIGIGTVRNMTVPVVVEVADTEPDEDMTSWDQVNECDFEVQSGRIVVAGCTDYFPEAARIDVEPASYRARIYYGSLDALSNDGLKGDDHYKVVLWVAVPGALRILKQRKNPLKPAN
jgi:hypothetical protein